MPRFEPFPALRYSTTADLDAVTAPPYDVLSPSDVRRLGALDPHNIVHVDVPLDDQGPTRYVDAGTRLDDWEASGAMVGDPAPSFTLYRMEFVDERGRSRTTVGVVGALEVVDEGAPGVRAHERTTPKAASDRLDLTRATKANLSPVWGLSTAEGLTDLLSEPGELMGSTTDEHGVVHRVERVVDPVRCQAISERVASAPVVIADGHHRYAISRTWRDEIRARTGRSDTGAELTLAYLGELVEEQLNVAAIHRLYDGVEVDTLRDALASFFEMSPAGPVSTATLAEMERRSALCLVDAFGEGTWLVPRPDAFLGVRDLDSARLEHALAAVSHEVRYQHGVDEVLGAVTTGEAVAAILIRPVSIAEIRRTADEGTLMPPKSTFFSPKLRTGLFLRRVTID